MSELLSKLSNGDILYSNWFIEYMMKKHDLLDGNDVLNFFQIDFRLIRLRSVIEVSFNDLVIRLNG